MYNSQFLLSSPQRSFINAFKVSTRNFFPDFNLQTSASLKFQCHFNLIVCHLYTGTPAGVGMGFDPPRFLRAGDVVRCEIEGIGVLENTVEG